MSGKPSADKVWETRVQLREYEAVTREVEAKRATLRECTARLEAILPRQAEAKRRVLECLSEMDVDSRGNAGWDGRVMWFLAELFRQVKTEERT